MANRGCVIAIGRCLRGMAVFLPLLLAGLGASVFAATLTGTTQASAEPAQKDDSALAEQLPNFVLDAAPQKTILQNLAVGADRQQRDDEREKALVVRQSQENKRGIRPDQGVEQQTGSSESGGVQDIVVAVMFGIAALILVTRRRTASPSPDS